MVASGRVSSFEVMATRLPYIYDSLDDLRNWRNRLEENLATMKREGFRSDIEHVPTINLFLLAYQGLNDRDVLRDYASLIAPPPDPHQIAGFLNDLASKSLAQLHGLARKFGEPDPESRSETWLIAFLSGKAKDVARLLSEVEALRGLSDRIDNTLGAALSL